MYLVPRPPSSVGHRGVLQQELGPGVVDDLVASVSLEAVVGLVVVDQVLPGRVGLLGTSIKLF